MATGTAYYNLTKPASTENYNVGVWNTNLDMIDAQMHQNETETFTGATSLANGTVGNVPAPTIADKDKYLKGDGTWDTPSGGGGGGAGTDEMTLAEYNELTEQQKNDGTIRFIPAGSGGGTSTPLDMSNLTAFREGAMGVVATSSTETNVSWSGGSSIGCTFYYTTPIDVTDYSTIKFTATNGQCYDGTVSQAMSANWNLQIGLQIAAPTAVQVITKTDSRWAAVEDMNLANHTYEGSVDVSNLTGTYYLVINTHGWNTVIEDITLDTGGVYPSQIKYMSKTYAEVSVDKLDFTQLSAQQITDLQTALGINS